MEGVSHRRLRRSYDVEELHSKELANPNTSLLAIIVASPSLRAAWCTYQVQ